MFAGWALLANALTIVGKSIIPIHPIQLDSINQQQTEFNSIKEI